MYPSFKNKQDATQKRKAYLAQIELDNAMDQAKQEAYANMIWASDIEAKISRRRHRLYTQCCVRPCRLPVLLLEHRQAHQLSLLLGCRQVPLSLLA